MNGDTGKVLLSSIKKTSRQTVLDIMIKNYYHTIPNQGNGNTETNIP